MLHDIGYVCTPGKPKFKFIHALIGRIMAGDLLQKDDNLGTRILQSNTTRIQFLIHFQTPAPVLRIYQKTFWTAYGKPAGNTLYINPIEIIMLQSCLQAGTSGCSLKIPDVLADMHGTPNTATH